jgi:hypothetical protein
MSPRTNARDANAKYPWRKSVPVFAALGDETRLRLVADAGLVHDLRQGRERLWQLEPSRLEEARRSLDAIAEQWDQALGRLKGILEK